MTLYSETLKHAVNAILSDVHTALPGVIESYDPSKRSATVKPTLKKKFLSGEELDYPIIGAVPVIFPSGGGASITFPLSRGDGVWILFSERSIEAYLSGSGQIQTPSSARKFALSDAVCIPGLFPFSGIPTNGYTNGLELLYKNTKVQINDNDVVMEKGGATFKFDSSGITVTIGATTITLSATGVKASIAGLNYDLATHVHPTAATGPPSPPTPIPG